MYRFSTSIFSGLGLDFGASWASNLEPSWPKIVKTKYPLLLLSLLKLNIFKHDVLEGSGLDFKGPGLDFGSLRPRF